MSHPNQIPTSHRGLLWLIFRAPGALLLWIEYHWPKAGDAWGSARRYRQPIFEVFYSLGFWAIVLIALLSFIVSSVGSR